MWWYIAHEEKCSKVESSMPLGDILGCWQGGNVETFSAAGKGFAKISPRRRQVYNALHQLSLTAHVYKCTNTHCRSSWCSWCLRVYCHLWMRLMSADMETVINIHIYLAVYHVDNCITTLEHPPRSPVENDGCRQYHPFFSVHSRDTACEELPVFLCQAQRPSLES